MVDLLRLGGQLLAQGQHGRLEGSQRRVQPQHGTHIGVTLLVGAHHFLVIGFAQECQRHTVAAQAGLDDIGDVVLVALLIEVVQRFAAGLLMAAQIVIRAVSDAPQLAPAVAADGGPDRNPCGQRCPTARPSRCRRGTGTRYRWWHGSRMPALPARGHAGAGTPP